MNKAYISLGSNKGQRLEGIRKALFQIQKRIGVLTDLSSLYETPAWGFEGPNFLNACIGIQTGHTPLEVLENLLAIEQQMGRKRPTKALSEVIPPRSCRDHPCRAAKLPYEFKVEQKITRPFRPYCPETKRASTE